jgi:hypothetical protein
MTKNELYLQYVDQCHSSVPVSKRTEIDSKSSEDRWAVRGTLGAFKWWALTSYYHPDFHNMTEEKKKANSHFQSQMALPGCLIGYSFMESINEDEETRNLFRQPVFLNVSAYLTGQERDNMLKFEELLYESVEQAHDVFYFNQQHQQMAVRQPLIMGKDLIFPYYRASEVMLENFAMLAPGLIAAGANTVSALFVCRIKPTIDGKTPTYFSEGFRIPIIQNPGGFF